MKKLTRKQRGEIYLKVYKKYLSNKKPQLGICNALKNEIGIYVDLCEVKVDLRKAFKEFWSFEPTIYNNWTSCYWFTQEERLIALLLSYEMTRTERL